MITAATEGTDRLRLEHSGRTDQQLVAAANDGQSAAFEELYWRYRDWVLSVSHRYTRDDDLALDVLQEVFIYFLKKFPGFKLRCELKTFLYPAVRNVSISLRQNSEIYTAA